MSGIPNDSALKLSWPSFFREVSATDPGDLRERIDLLKFLDTQLRTARPFQSLPADVWRIAAGLRKKEDVQRRPEINAARFGYMGASGEFAHVIKIRHQSIADAVDAIPFGDAPVTRTQFDKYRDRFEAAFTQRKNRIGGFSRLLAMKRPDQFVCLTSQNKRTLTGDFGVPQTVSYDAYWDRIIVPIRKSAWWNALQPEEGMERDVWRWRVALIDVLYRERTS